MLIGFFLSLINRMYSFVELFLIDHKKLLLFKDFLESFQRYIEKILN